MITHRILKIKILKFPKKIRFYSCLPDIDMDYYCDLKNQANIKRNIERRKGIGDIDRVHEIYNLLKVTQPTTESYYSLKETLYQQLANLPNKTHPTVETYQEDPHVIHEINVKRDFGAHKPLEFSVITNYLNLIRTDKLGYTCGNKSYYYLGELAELEEALTKYTITNLIKRNFQLVSVPDILSSHVLESCGMSINSDRTQVNLL